MCRPPACKRNWPIHIVLSEQFLLTLRPLHLLLNPIAMSVMPRHSVPRPNLLLDLFRNIHHLVGG